MRYLFGFFATLFALSFATGCTGWGGSKPPVAEDLTIPGHYPPPEMPTPRLRVAVAEFWAPNAIGIADEKVIPALGADELWSLLDSSNRYDLTPRARLNELLANQKFTDLLESGILTHPSPVKGFDYLLLTRVNQLSITKEPPPDKVSVEGVKQMLHMDDTAPKNLVVDAKVELALVDPRTGVTYVNVPTDVHRVATPKVLNVKVTDADLASEQPIKLADADTHQVIRMILDAAVRSTLPRIDNYAATTTGNPQTPTLAHVTPATIPAPNSPQPDNNVLTAKVICPECGAKVSSELEFCPNCGHKLK